MRSSAFIRDFMIYVSIEILIPDLPPAMSTTISMSERPSKCCGAPVIGFAEAMGL
jgi:hypothetical protein